jgi:sugar fermentation stimulation protein A
MDDVLLLEIEGALEGTFLARPNRFLCSVSVQDSSTPVQAHVADPGRLGELLFPGNPVLVKRAPEGGKRKTGYSLLAAATDTGWVLVNTTYHRAIAGTILRESSISPFGKICDLRAEVTPVGMSSRFDYLVTADDGSRMWLEVKGCTLASGKTALFPDAPTSRGRKHLEELTSLRRSGERASVMFLVMAGGVDCLRANPDTDPGFAALLRNAVDTGVNVVAVLLAFDGRRILYRGELPVCV